MDRACPQCATPAAADQDWCLECGTRIEQPRARWQQPVAIMASVALIFVAAIALALSEVAKDADIAKAKTVKRYVAAAPPPAATTPPAPDTPTPSSSDKPTPGSSKNPTDGSTPSSSSDSGSSSTDTSGLSDTSGGGYIPPPSSDTGSTDTTPVPPEAEVWPTEKKAWTVILLSTTSKDEATQLALKAHEDDVPAGILQSDDFKNQSSGLWLVWAGRYSSEDEAYGQAEVFSGKGYPGESVQYIRKKTADEPAGGTDTTTTETTPTTGG